MYTVYVTEFRCYQVALFISIHHFKSLIPGNEIKSAVDHTKIEGAPEERIYLQYESQKIADRAIQNLKRSRDDLKMQNITQPTWTGRAGYNKQVQQ